MSELHIPQLTPSKLSSIFRLSMAWRILYGSIRVILAFVLFKLVGSTFTDLLSSIMSHELVTDPTDALFRFLYVLIEDRSFTVTYFLASYLLFWGVIDIVLSVQLIRNKLWAFPVSMWLMVLFVIYAIYRVFHTHSFILVGIIGIDLFIIYIVYRKYRLLTKQS